jgi:hypothetical protein
MDVKGTILVGSHPCFFFCHFDGSVPVDDQKRCSAIGAADGRLVVEATMRAIEVGRSRSKAASEHLIAVSRASVLRRLIRAVRFG